MAIDIKYGRVQLEHGTVGKEEPVVVFRAQDRLLPSLLAFYRDLCAHSHSPQRHLDGVEAAREQVLAWQAGNHTQVPQSAPIASGQEG